ncbi:MAG: type II secretion system protein [Nitrospiria bacterium]
MKAIRNTRGFTMVEVVVVIGIVALLAGILVPLISQNLEDAKRARAKNEAVVIASAIGSLYKDVGMWPWTNADGPTSTSGVNLLYTGSISSVPTAYSPNPAVAGEDNWGVTSNAKSLADFVYFNNPDDDTGKTLQNESGEDYTTSGEFKWRGPYVEKPTILDPWGQSYVVNAKYLPGNPAYTSTVKHRVYVLSAGPNRKWETPFSDTTGDGDDEIKGDDIGVTITVR